MPASYGGARALCMVEALYDRGGAERATLTNLLQRRGYVRRAAVVQKVAELFE